MAGMYAVYHGAEGLKAIGERIHMFTRMLDFALNHFGFKQLNKKTNGNHKMNYCKFKNISK